MYVSTVDSGNLAGHLLVLRLALLEVSEAPLLGPQLLDGMRDAALLALEDLVACQDELGPPADRTRDARGARRPDARDRHRRDPARPGRMVGAAQAARRARD